MLGSDLETLCWTERVGAFVWDSAWLQLVKMNFCYEDEVIVRNSGNSSENIAMIV